MEDNSTDDRKAACSEQLGECLENTFLKHLRRHLFNTWGSLIQLWKSHGEVFSKAPPTPNKRQVIIWGLLMPKINCCIDTLVSL